MPILSAIIISGCSFGSISDKVNNIINPDGTSCTTGEIGYTGEAYGGLVNEIGLNTGDINFTTNLTGSMSGLAKTNNSGLYISPLYSAIDGCNRESRYTRLFETNISMLVMNCKLEDGLYTVNYTDDNTWTEDKYIGGERVPQNNIMQVFSRKNISNFDDLGLSLPKGCIRKNTINSNIYEEREIVTDDTTTVQAEAKLQENNSYLPCGEYGYTAVGRKRFTIFKSKPQLVFRSNVNYEYPLFDVNTIKME